MTAPHADQLIDGYLARLNAAAADLPKSARQELLDDMRAHIAEALVREQDETDATILNILDRLGEPAVVVAEARERLGLRMPVPYRPGAMEIAAIVLVPLIWPVGVVLLWISPAWKVRDKLIGTLLPPGGFLGLPLILELARVAFGGIVIVTGSSPWEALVGVLILAAIFLLPLITAAYLAFQLRSSRHRELATA
jgi:hypothetical protein